MLTESCTWQAPHLSQLQDQASTLYLSTCKSSCKCCYFHERTNASVCGCIYLVINYMHICTPECYILLTSLTHTCHSCVRDFFFVIVQQRSVFSVRKFIVFLKHIVAYEAMRRHRGARVLHRQADRDSDSLFCCSCVLVATNQCCREEPCLNSHYCPTRTALIL